MNLSQNIQSEVDQWQLNMNQRQSDKWILMNFTNQLKSINLLFYLCSSALPKGIDHNLLYIAFKNDSFDHCFSHCILYFVFVWISLNIIFTSHCFHSDFHDYFHCMHCELSLSLPRCTLTPLSCLHWPWLRESPVPGSPDPGWLVDCPPPSWCGLQCHSPDSDCKTNDDFSDIVNIK